MEKGRRWRWTSVLIIALVGFLLGLACARLTGTINVGLLWISCILLFASVLAWRRDKRIFYAALIMFCCVFGWWRGSTYVNELNIYDQIFYKNIVLEAAVLEDAVYGENGQLTFTANNMRIVDPISTDLVGQIEISGLGINAVYRGDKVLAEGRVFPKRGANQAGMSFAKIEILSKGNSPIDVVRRQFAAGMQNALPEPLASFALGLLIGQRNTLDEKLNEILITVGLVHIVAVSGYNLTIIINASRGLFAKRSRYQSLLASLILIGLFLLLTGNSPSIVRAALVSAMGLFAWYFGRKFRPVLLLLLAAAITAGINPLYLWSNVGWYLSFTAFFGVLVLAPLLQERFLPKKLRGQLMPSVLVETTAAQLCTLPIILFIFGRLSLVSIVANLMVIPIVPFAMLTSLFAGLSGMTDFALTGLVAFPAKFILEYMLSVSSLLSKIPHANVSFSISLAQMFFMYILLLGFVILLHKRLRSRRATISPEIKE